MRLDSYLVLKDFFDSRTKSSQAIERGEVLVNGGCVNKPSYSINENQPQLIEITTTQAYVSLGGYKLEKALYDFKLNVANLVAIDVGSSTGGFTDCLLKHGAKKVYAVDLNDDLLHKTLKNDDRVVSVIKNAKNLSPNDFNQPIDFLCADLSFISAKQVIPVFYHILPKNKYAVLLIKPQFETGEKRKFKNGIIKDEKIRLQACKNIYDCCIENGFNPLKITTAPIREKKNVEYLILLQKSEVTPNTFEQIFK